MVVQYILAVRKGRRELKPNEILPPGETPAANPEKETEEKETKEVPVDKEEEEIEKPADTETDTPKMEVEEENTANVDSKEEELPSVVVSSKESETTNNLPEEKLPETVEKSESTESKEVADSSENANTENANNEVSTNTTTAPWREVDEYFVKYRNFSYLHCEWKSEEELFKGDKRIAAKLKRFKQKMAHNTNIFENLEEEPYNPDFVEVDRVLDVAEHQDPNTGAATKHYLVKWKSMQYEDSTWELEEDVDPVKIAQFEVFRKRPPKDKIKPKKKPSPDEWVKLDDSPNYNNGNKLRAYQLEGLNWLLFSWYNG